MDRTTGLPRIWCIDLLYPTSYDRGVSLAAMELPAKDVPEPFRWRLVKLPAIPPRHRYRGRTGPWSRSTTQRSRRAGSSHAASPLLAGAVDRDSGPRGQPMPATCPIEQESAGNSGERRRSPPRTRRSAFHQVSWDPVRRSKLAPQNPTAALDLVIDTPPANPSAYSM